MTRRIAMITIHGDPTAKPGSEEQGGQPIYVRNLSAKLRQRGYQIDVFTRRKSPTEKPLERIEEGVRVIKLKAGELDFTPKTELYDYLNGFFANFLRFTEEEGRAYSLIHSHYWLSGVVGLKAKDFLEVPLVHTSHSWGRVKYDVMGAERDEYAHIRLKEEELILRRVNAVIATSPQEVKNILDLYEVDGENITLIRAGVDENLFRVLDQEECKAKLGIDSDHVILFVGRITKAKGLRTLIKAIGLLKQSLPPDETFMLALVGGDSGDQQSGEESAELKYLRSLIRELDIADLIRMEGAVPRERLPVYYSAADVCVVPSLYESFGLVAVEAMACGTPVVASRVGGLRHTVKDGYSGFHVVPSDEEGMAEKIHLLLEDKKLCQRIGENAHQRVREEFTWERTARQVNHLYQSLLI